MIEVSLKFFLIYVFQNIRVILLTPFKHRNKNHKSSHAAVCYSIPPHQNNVNKTENFGNFVVIPKCVFAAYSIMYLNTVYVVCFMTLKINASK